MTKKVLLSSVFSALLCLNPAMADTVQMKTATPVGEKMLIALNAGLSANLTWGDGTEENVVFSGDELEITVKHADLTVTTDKAITMLYCPDCALTELHTDGAPMLSTLVCADNQLKTLEISKNVHLKDLNCSGNQITAVSLTKCKELVNLNVENNRLTAFSVSGLADLQTVLCGGNQLKTLYLNTQADLKGLWCQDNTLSNINFAGAARPVQVVAYNNELTKLASANLVGVKDLWVDNNQLQEIDLSTAAPEVVSASHNQLTTVLLNKNTKSALKAFYVNDNGLMINSLPTVLNNLHTDTLVAYNIDNQAPYVITDKASLALNERIQFNQYYRVNAWAQYARAEVNWKNAAGTDLVKGKDFMIYGSNYAFLQPHKGVFAEITSVLYPTVVFKTVPFDVVDPTGVEDVWADELKVSAKDGKITVAVAAETSVKMYNLAGVQLVDEVVAAGSHSWTLPAGIYIVNGKKVTLSK